MGFASRIRPSLLVALLHTGFLAEQKILMVMPSGEAGLDWWWPGGRQRRRKQAGLPTREQPMSSSPRKMPPTYALPAPKNTLFWPPKYGIAHKYAIGGGVL